MKKLATRRPRVGAVIEIRVAGGFAYAQYTHEHSTPPRYGSLLRIMPGIFAERPDLDALVAGPTQFVTFFPLRADLAREDTKLQVIAEHPVPPHASDFPTFRNGLPDVDGRVHVWWTWDGVTEQRVGPLTPALRAMPQLGICNDTALFEMIAAQYDASRDV